MSYMNVGYNNGVRLDFETVETLFDVTSSLPLSPIDFDNLSHVYRYVGQTTPRVSVAQHTVLATALLRYILDERPRYLVEILCEDTPDYSEGILFDLIEVEEFANQLTIAVAFHDLHEAITGDIPAPIKALLGDTISRVETAIDERIYASLIQSNQLITDVMSPTVQLLMRRVDYLAYALERCICSDNADWNLSADLLSKMKRDRNLMELTEYLINRDVSMSKFILDIQRRYGCLSME